MTLATLSFFVVYREGFETVLFYQALMLDAPPFWVLGGFAAGVIGIAALAYLLLRVGRRLPIRTFFKATGVVLILLATIFIGNGVRGLQTAGVIGATAVPGFPESTFLQLYLGLFPVAEPLIAQSALLVLLAAAWLWTRHRAGRTAHHLAMP